MKKLILTAIAIAFLFVACNSNSENTKESSETKTVDTIIKNDEKKPVVEQLYACPMHPEVTGKKDESCSKCGMKLTVLVKNPQ